MVFCRDRRFDLWRYRLRGKAQAALVTATITGTVYGGTDAGSNGGVFGPAPTTGVSLAGRNFTLVYTFDDTLGTQSSGPSGATPYYSSISGSGASSPGTAVLTIGDISVNVPNPASPQATNTSSAYRDVHSQLFNFSVSGTNGVVQASLGDNANILTTNYSWEASFNYTWTDGGNNNVSFSYSIVTDTSFAEASGTLTAQSITVVGPSSIAPPTAANETTSTNAGVPVSIDLTVGATGNPTSAAVVGTPIGGTVSISGTTATFTPTAGFSGAASFQFTLANAGGTSNTATASITVTAPLPAPPVAVAYAGSTRKNTPITFSLPYSPNGGIPTSATIGTVTGGTVSAPQNLTVTFTPTKGYTGSAGFSFTLSNAGGASTARAIITIESLHIYVNNIDQTSKTVTVVVGQPINLRASIAGQTQTWTLDQIAIVAGFNPPDPPSPSDPCPTQIGTVAPAGCKGNAVPVDPSSFTQVSPSTFYWVTPGSNRTAEYKYFNSDGSSDSATVTFNVLGPTKPIICTFAEYHPSSSTCNALKLETPTVEIDKSRTPPRLGLNGIVFVPSFDLPSNPQLQITGRYEWVQILASHELTHTQISEGKSKCTAETLVNSPPSLDNTFPYKEGFRGVGQSSPTPPLNAPAADKPDTPLKAPNTKETLAFYATMYLMWKADGTGNIEVPLGQVSWGFTSAAVFTPASFLRTAGWQLEYAFVESPDFVASVSSADYPKWSNVAVNHVPYTSQCQ